MSFGSFKKSFCFICQKKRSDNKLSVASSEGIERFKEAAEDIFETIDTYLQNVPTMIIKWHRVCNGNFINILQLLMFIHSFRLEKL